MGSNLDLSRISLSNVTGANTVPLTGAAITESDGLEIKITLTEVQRTLHNMARPENDVRVLRRAGREHKVGD